MFWGLIMEPQRRYSQVVKKSFHISMAALDISTSNEEPAQVMCGFEGRNYLLCTLKKPNMVQCPLDLNFEVGSEVSFATNGKCHVHLTGYLTEDVMPGIDDEEDEEEAEIEEVEEDEDDAAAKKGKRQNSKSLNGPPAKKVKSEKAVTSTQQKVSDDDDDDSDDSDVDMSQLLLQESDSDEDENADDSDDEEEDQAEEEDDGAEEDDEDLDEEEDDDEDDDEVSSLSDDEPQIVVKSKGKDKSKLNGDVKKADLKQQKANATSPQKQNKQAETKTPKSEKKQKGEKQNAEQKTPGKDQKKTPLKEQQSKTPGKEGKTPGKEGKTPAKEQGKTPGKEGKTPKKRTVQGGVVIEDIVEGAGEVAKLGKHVHVYYEGRFRDNNKMFDSTTKGSGFGFRLGKGEVIKGWDVGVVGMRQGGKRRITCPPGMAYGQKGCPPEIPPNSTLVFEVELKKIS